MTPRNPSRARGFTLVELLVVIGILVVLIGIATVAFRGIDPSGKATRITLQNAAGLLAELQATSNSSMPSQLIWNGGAAFSKGDPRFGNFWVDPFIESPNVDSPVLNPGVLSDEQGRASDAFRNTVAAMSLLRAIPANRDAMSKLSSDAQFQMKVDDPVTAVDERKVPMLLDAWGNPILFIPGNGIQAVRVGDNDDIVVRAPNNRPFFASAGPDGNMATGDDNVYSFQQ